MNTMKKIRDQRSAIFLTFGAALLGAPVLAGCEEEPKTTQATQKGVLTVIKEDENGSFKIEDEKIVDGLSRVVIMYRDGKTETITDPDAFAQKLPQQAPPANYFTGGGHSGGFDLADVLLMSMVMDAWRPAYYPPTYYSAPPTVYRSSTVYRDRESRRSTYSGYARRGVAPSGAASARTFAARPQTAAPAAKAAPQTRAAAPSRSSSGFGKASPSRGGFGG